MVCENSETDKKRKRLKTREAITEKKNVQKVNTQKKKKTFYKKGVFVSTNSRLLSISKEKKIDFV